MWRVVEDAILSSQSYFLDKYSINFHVLSSYYINNYIPGFFTFRCPFCKADEQFQEYEARLYSFVEK